MWETDKEPPRSAAPVAGGCGPRGGQRAPAPQPQASRIRAGALTADLERQGVRGRPREGVGLARLLQAGG